MSTRKFHIPAAFSLLLLASLSCSLFSSSQEIHPQDVIDAFSSAGLVADNPRPMTPDDYGMAPLADEGIRFFITSICPDCGGRVMYYEDPAFLEKARTYYTTLGKENAALFSWVFIRDHILVQINGKLPEDQARKYEQALQDLN